MGIDLGTYHVRVKFQDSSGFVMEWSTSGRFVPGGTGAWTPLASKWIAPLYDSEEDLIQGILFQFSENNYSCDCNRKLFCAYANQLERPDHNDECTETLRIREFSIIRPDGTVIDYPEMIEE